METQIPSSASRRVLIRVSRSSATIQASQPNGMKTSRWLSNIYGREHVQSGRRPEKLYMPVIQHYTSAIPQHYTSSVPSLTPSTCLSLVKIWYTLPSLLSRPDAMKVGPMSTRKSVQLMAFSSDRSSGDHEACCVFRPGTHARGTQSLVSCL